MSYTLLQQVNRLRVLLREEERTALDATNNIDDSAYITLINRAKNHVLNGYDWDFSHRWDAMFTVNPNFAGVGGAESITVANQSSTVTMTNWVGTQQQANHFGLVTPWFRSKLDSIHPDTWYRIETITVGGVGTLTATLERPWEGDTATVSASGEASFSTIPLQFRSTEEFGIRRVLSIMHEETPLDIRTVERPLDFNTFLPNKFLQTSAKPQIAFVGGATKGIGITGSIVAVGSVNVAPTSWLPALTIWPAPGIGDNPVVLRMDYIKRHPDLLNDTDTWDAVPYEIVDLVVDRAFVDALQSSVQNDPERAQVRMAQFAADFARAKRLHRVNPLQRNGIVPFGDHGSRVHPNHRWASRIVPTP